MNTELKVNVGLAGFYKLEAVHARTGKRRLLADWFPNIITNWGLEAKGTGLDSSGGTYSNIMRYCHVGSGNTAPTAADTTLVSHVASTQVLELDTSATQASAPYYVSNTRTYRFAEGVAAGNLSEIGVGPLGGSSDSLFSRALILDGLGDPTTITVLADEFLDATYQLRMYPPTGDFSATVDGYAVVARAAGVTNSTYWRGGNLGEKFVWAAFGSRDEFYDGSIGATIVDAPTGTSSLGQSSVSTAAYVPGSLELAGTHFAGLSVANFAGGIDAMIFGSWQIGHYQASFDPPIPKGATEELTVTFKVSWSRATI